MNNDNCQTLIRKEAITMTKDELKEDLKISVNKINKRVEPKIGWSLWIDPFDIDKLNLPDDLSEEEDLDNLYGGKYEKLAEERENNFADTSMLTKKPFKLAITQIGVIPFYENTLPSKLFKFYEGHTNFSISQKIADIIDKTEGVETLDVFTKYRMRISVGKMFDSKEVRKNIQDRITKALTSKKED